MNVSDEHNPSPAMSPESRLKSLIGSASMVICQIAPTGKILFVNDYVKRVTGYDSKYLIGKSWWNIFYPRKLKAQVGELSKRFAGKGKHADVVDYEMTLQHKDGSLRILSWNSFNAYDKDGSLQEINGIGIDITERKKAEEKILQTNAFNSAIVENAPFGIMIINPDGGVDYVNPALLLISGSSMDNFREMNIFKLPTYVKNGLSAKIRSCFKGKSFFIGSLKYISHFSKKMTVRNFTGIPMRSEQSKVEQVMLFIEDITERKKAETELVESESRLSEAQKMARLGNWVWDIKSGNVEWSEEVFRIFGLDSKKFTPQIDSIQALSPWPEDHARDKELIRRAMKSHEVGTYEQRFLRPDKSVGYYYSSFQGKYDAKGNLITIIGTVQDITERKKADEELARLLLRQESILSAVPDIIMEVNNKKIYTWANQSGFDFFGAGVIGKEASYYFEGDQDTYDIVKPVFKGVESVTYLESWQRRKDGEKRLLAWWCKTLKDKSGNVIGALSLAQDITERRNAEQRIKSSEDQARLQAKETGILNEIILVGNQTPDLQSLMKSVVDETLRLLSFSGGGLYLKDAGEIVAKLAYSKGLNPEFVRMAREVDIRKEPFSIIFLKKSAIFTSDYSVFNPAVAKKFGIVSLASVPIFSKNEVIGAFNVMGRKHHEFSESEKRLLNSIGRAVGTSIVNRLAEENLLSRTLELENFSKMTIGRELKMVELKKRIEELELKFGKNIDEK